MRRQASLPKGFGLASVVRLSSCSASVDHSVAFAERRAPLSHPSAASGPGLLRPTSLWRIRHLPSTAPAVRTNTRDYEAARRFSALSSRDAFLHRVHGFSRVNFDPAQRPQVHAYLSEALEERRMADLPAKTVHDMTHLAFVAGLHELCLALYHAKRHHDAQTRGVSEPAAHTSGETVREGEGPAIPPSKRFVNNFLVSQYVVDSAYATENVVELLRIASYCARCAKEDRAAGAPAEVMTVFSLFRCLWRAVCLSEHFLQNEVAGTHSAGGSSKEALEAARLMLTDYILPFVKATPVDKGGAAHRGGSSQPGRQAKYQLQEGSLDAFMRAVQRMVKYDTSGDDGEMLFYRHCLRSGCLVVPRGRASPAAGDAAAGQTTDDGVDGTCDVTVADVPMPFAPEDDDVGDASLAGGGYGVQESNLLTSSASAGSGNIVSHVNDVELFYAALIDTCATGRHASAAMQYFADAREDCLAWPQPTSFTSSPLGVEGELLPASLTGGNNSNHSNRREEVLPRAAAVSATRTVMSEYVLYRLLAVLQHRRDNKRIVQLARTVLDDKTRHGEPAAIGISVWSVFLISAGEARAVDVALAAFRYAQDRVRRSSPATNERRGFEYLLQTALNALSKCQLANFEEDYLIPAQEADMLHCTRSFYYCCLLQDAHNSLNPAERADAILARMEAEDVALSVAATSRLLKLYLRCESPLLLSAYKAAVTAHGLARRAWLDELIVWADRRRYFLSQEDRLYVLAQVEEATRSGGDRVGDAAGMGGLRTQLALLEHDAKVQPREYFVAHGVPPDTEPTVMDSRVHFLLKRPQRVLQGISAAAEAHSDDKDGAALPPPAPPGQSSILSPAALAVLGDPTRLSALVNKAAAAGVPPLLLSSSPSSVSGSASRAAPAASSVPSLHHRITETESQWHEEATRLYLAEMLEGLQRSRNHVL